MYVAEDMIYTGLMQQINRTRTLTLSFGSWTKFLNSSHYNNDRYAIICSKSQLAMHSKPLHINNQTPNNTQHTIKSNSKTIQTCFLQTSLAMSKANNPFLLWLIPNENSTQTNLIIIIRQHIHPLLWKTSFSWSNSWPQTPEMPQIPSSYSPPLSKIVINPNPHSH